MSFNPITDALGGKVGHGKALLESAARLFSSEAPALAQIAALMLHSLEDGQEGLAEKMAQACAKVVQDEQP